MEFDLQRFDDEQVASTEPQPSQETSTEEKPPIPEELGGLDEEYAREVMNKWAATQPAKESESERSTQKDKTIPQPAEEPPITREDYQAKINEIEKLKAQIAALQSQQPQSQPRQKPLKQQTPQYQPPQFKLTPEISAKLNTAIKAEAIAMTGFSDDIVASLEYADADDPHLEQWSQAKTIATNRVLNAVQQAQQIQQAQAQQFISEHNAAIDTYNRFAHKEMAEPDYKEIVQFGTNEFFEQQPKYMQDIIAKSYFRVERQTASPAEMLNVLMFYEKAKAAYRARGAKAKPTANQPKQAVQMPRVDQLGGSATTSDGQLSARDIEKLLEGDFTKLSEKQQRQMLGLT